MLKRGLLKLKIQIILCIDLTALYLKCLASDVPTGLHVIRKIEMQFQPQYRKEYIKHFLWMDYTAEIDYKPSN